MDDAIDIISDIAMDAAPLFLLLFNIGKRVGSRVETFAKKWKNK
jgi:hypothetical protein